MTRRGSLVVDGEEFLPFIGKGADKAIQDVSQKLRKRVTYVPHEAPGGGDDVVA